LQNFIYNFDKEGDSVHLNVYYNLKERERMTRNKTTTAIAILLILTFVVSIVALPTANAHDPAWNIASFAYVVAAPSPVG
jgi:hypothetical protein